MRDIENELQEKGDFYFYKVNQGYPTKLFTHDKIYKLEDSYSKIVADFEKKNNLNAYKINCAIRFNCV